MTGVSSNERPMVHTPSPIKVILAVGTYDGGVASYEMDLQSDTTTNSSTPTSNNETTKRNKLQLIFASPIHQGSVRSLMVTAINNNSNVNNNNSNATKKNKDNYRDTKSDQNESHIAIPNKYILVSTGYDEMMKIHDYSKHVTCNGELRLPTQYGTPTCSSFAPPYRHPSTLSTAATTTPTLTNHSTHCLIGFIGSTEHSTSATAGAGKVGNTKTGGSLVIYKKRDWSVQHVLHGHEGGGISSIAVHPTGKLALSGGINDGKLKVWDLQRGRLSYTSTIQPKRRSVTPSSSTTDQHQQRKHPKEYDAIVCIVWSEAGDCYGYCYGNHITVQHVETGKDLLDVELPSKVNQICFIDGNEGLFVAAACNDGSLPVLAIENISTTLSKENDIERRAIMAIEPVDGPIAGEERFKCIQSIIGYYVATANSAGVVSVMNLQGAVNMITSPSVIDDIENDDVDDNIVDEGEGESDVEDDDDDDDDDNSDKELAVDFIDSVQVGNGARITCLVAWATPMLPGATDDITGLDKEQAMSVEEHIDNESDVDNNLNKKKRPMKSPTLKKGNDRHTIVELDSEALNKARALVVQAKKIQQKKHAKRMKK
jgi:WD40 repeat protein